jgi:heat shock protein HslJ
MRCSLLPSDQKKFLEQLKKTQVRDQQPSSQKNFLGSAPCNRYSAGRVNRQSH